MADEKKSDGEKPKAPPKVTAFELNPDVVGDNDTHPFTFGGFPGLWQVGRPVLPSALGLTLERMRELVDQFNLPLVEVKVREGSAHDTFEVPANHIESGTQELEPTQAQPELLEVNGQLIPGPIPAPPGPTVQPFAAEMIRRDTERAIAAGAIAEDVEVPEAGDEAGD